MRRIDDLEKLGEGGEAEVFALDEERVLRRFRGDHPSIERRVTLTAGIASGADHLDFEVPTVLDRGIGTDGRPWFVERRLPGRSMTDALADVTGAPRRALFESYLSTAATLREIRFDVGAFGEVIAEDALTAPTWSGYLTAALDRQHAAADPSAYPEVTDLEATLGSIRAWADACPDPTPSLVHFDYFPGNVLCDGRRITAVIDWSVLAIVGDPDLDVSLAVAYLGVTPTATDADRRFCRSWLADRSLDEQARAHERWAAAWWLPLSDDPSIRGWVADVLHEVTPRSDPGAWRRSGGGNR